MGASTGSILEAVILDNVFFHRKATVAWWTANGPATERVPESYWEGPLTRRKPTPDMRLRANPYLRIADRQHSISGVP